MAFRLKVVSHVLTVITDVGDWQTTFSDDLVVDVNLLLSQLHALECVATFAEHKPFLSVPCEAVKDCCTLVGGKPLAQDFSKHRVEE